MEENFNEVKMLKITYKGFKLLPVKYSNTLRCLLILKEEIVLNAVENEL